MTGADDLATELEALYERGDCLYEEFCSVLERARAICEALTDLEG